VVAIVMVVVPSFAHIKASVVPMPVSLTDRNSDAAAPDIGAFRDDNWFVADVQRTGKCRHRQEWKKKKGKHSILHDILLGLGRPPSQCSTECALGIPEVCIELTSAVLETLFERAWFRSALIRYRLGVAGLIQRGVRVQRRAAPAGRSGDRVRGEADRGAGGSLWSSVWNRRGSRPRRG
jgi:hypothetical protein